VFFATADTNARYATIKLVTHSHTIQCLLTLLDGPLNKSGTLRIYIHTQNNVLIEVNPQIRIPRTFKRFCGLMVQLLHKLHIKASEGNTVLMKVIKNPITDHIPANSRKICMSYHSKQIIKLPEYIPAVLTAGKNANPDSITFIVGGYAHGELKVDYADDFVAISQYSLSAANVCSKICNTLEEYWGIM